MSNFGPSWAYQNVNLIKVIFHHGVQCRGNAILLCYVKDEHLYVASCFFSDFIDCCFACTLTRQIQRSGLLDIENDSGANLRGIPLCLLWEMGLGRDLGHSKQAQACTTYLSGNRPLTAGTHISVGCGSSLLLGDLQRQEQSSLLFLSHGWRQWSKSPHSWTMSTWPGQSLMPAKKLVIQTFLKVHDGLSSKNLEVVIHAWQIFQHWWV